MIFILVCGKFQFTSSSIHLILPTNLILRLVLFYYEMKGWCVDVVGWRLKKSCTKELWIALIHIHIIFIINEPHGHVPRSLPIHRRRTTFSSLSLYYVCSMCTNNNCVVCNITSFTCSSDSQTGSFSFFSLLLIVFCLFTYFYDTTMCNGYVAKSICVYSMCSLVLTFLSS